MRVLPLTSAHHLPAAVEAVREVVTAHGLVVLPTETFYGLAVNPRDPEAVAKVFAVKGRDTAKALLVVAANFRQAEELAIIPELWRCRLQKVWPAPLTVVFQARQALPGSGHTVAVRVPAVDLLRSLLAEVGPLTATSANLSGQAPAQTVQELGPLSQRVDLILDGGKTPGGLSSTLLDATVTPPRVLRQGAFAVPVEWLRG
ncbi:MAG: L-threonylcarbamoyladenylate synthase [Thermoanaerobaculum sp.]